VENSTAGLSPSEKAPEQIEQDMVQTRESITEKVTALENQVLGTLQNAANTVTNTVDAVKEAVTSAPSAVSDTVKNTVEAVKQTWQETVGSFSVSKCVQTYPAAALCTTVLGGFVIGYGLTSSRRKSEDQFEPSGGFTPRDLTARPPVEERANPPSMLSGVFAMITEQLRQVMEEATSSAMTALKQSVATHVPEVVDSAVEGFSNRLRDRHTVGTSMNGR
jgi:hypothetical protein